MPKFLKFVLTLALVGAVSLGVSMGQDEDAAKAKRKAIRHDKAKAAATKWVEAFGVNKTDEILKVSAVPFAFDRLEVLNSTKTLRSRLEGLIKKKVAKSGELKVNTVSIKDDVTQISDFCVPQDRVLVVVRLFRGERSGENASVLLCVRPGDTYKVIGFTWTQ